MLNPSNQRITQCSHYTPALLRLAKSRIDLDVNGSKTVNTKTTRI